MAIKELTSLQHPLVKHLVKLREDRAYRYASKRVVISGVKLIKELSSRFPLRTLFIEKGHSPSFPLQAESTYLVSSQMLKKATGLENPEPLAAEIDMPEEKSLSSCRYLLVLDGIADPGNLGTLLRSALALGWDGALITPHSTDPYNEKALRSAKGATFILPWKWASWEELDVPIYAADAKGKPLSACSFSSPLALALGNEAHGVSKSLMSRATSVAIPMREEMESLNVASAGAILMYAIRGQA